MAEYSFQVREIGDTILAMTDGQMAELRGYLAEHGGREPCQVPAQAPEDVGPPHDVTLRDYAPAKKISVIKTLRELTYCGLLEAKILSETTPCRVLKGVPKGKAVAAKKALEEAGARVEIEMTFR